MSKRENSILYAFSLTRFSLLVFFKPNVSLAWLIVIIKYFKWKHEFQKIPIVLAERTPSIVILYITKENQPVITLLALKKWADTAFALQYFLT